MKTVTYFRFSTLALLILIGFLASGCAEPEQPFLCPAELVFLSGEDEEVDHVEAIGSFNDWTPGANVFERSSDGTFSTTLELLPGDHHYKLIVDETIQLDTAQPLLARNAEGDDVSLLRVGDCSAPQWTLESVELDAGAIIVTASLLPGAAREAIDVDSIEAIRLTTAQPARELRVEDDRVIARWDVPDDGKHTIRLSGADQAGRQAEDLILPLWLDGLDSTGDAFDWSDALIYQIMIDRFAPSGAPLDEGLPREEALTARHGGDLVGLLGVLESGYFEELGVTAIWISPINDNPDEPWPWYLGLQSTAYHGYWPIAARSVEPLFGGDDAVDAFVEEAHARGLRVILDVVPNHVHIEHPYWLARADEGWFNGDGDCVCGSSCSWATDIDHCWFSEYLADFRWTNPDVARRVVADTMYWIERFDFDGLRIDAIPMMPLLATRELVQASRRYELGPSELHLLGETYTGEGDYDTITRALGPHGLDGQFDFPLMWQIRRVLGRNESTMDALDRVVRRSEETWAAVDTAGGRSIMSPFIGNHDVPRFLSEAAGDEVWDPVESPPTAPVDREPYDRLVLAQTLVLTLPGAPVLYFGDELGMPGATDPDNRRPMRFAEELSPLELDTFEQISRVGRLRTCLPSLRRGDRRTLLVEDDLYAYLRDGGDSAPAIVVLNRSDEPLEVELSLPEDLELPPDAGVIDALSTTPIPRSGRELGPFEIPLRSAMILIPEGNACSTLIQLD